MMFSRVLVALAGSNLLIASAVQILSSPSKLDVRQDALQTERPVLTIGLGAQKAGTTFFAMVMQALSNVRLGTLKELHYLDKPYSARDRCPGSRNGKDFFEEYVNACMNSTPPAAGETFMDFTPHYGSTLSCVGEDPDAEDDVLIERLQELSKRADVRLLMGVRDPVDRAISAINMYLTPDVFSSPFPKDATDDQVSKYIEDRMNTEDEYRFFCGGKYHRTIERVLNSGFDRSQLFVFDLKKVEELETYKKAFKTLGIPAPPDEEIQAAIEKSNTFTDLSNSHKYAPPAELRQKMKAYFKDHDDALRELLPFTSDWW